MYKYVHLYMHCQICQISILFSEYNSEIYEVCFGFILIFFISMINDYFQNTINLYKLLLVCLQNDRDCKMVPYFSSELAK